MSITVGQTVKLVLSDGTTTSGEVIDYGDFDLDFDSAWWVRYGPNKETELFFEVDLNRWNSNAKLECTCGSVAVGSDRHSLWCDAFQ